MRYLIRFLWLISLLGFLFNLFTTYGNLGLDIQVALGDWVIAKGRNGYFFFFLVFFLALNLVLYALGNALANLPARALPVPRSGFWTSGSEHRVAANHILRAWTLAMACTLNYFIMYWMLLLENEFHFEGNTISAVSWFAQPGYAMAISLILPFFRFFIPNANLLARKERDE